MNSSKIGSGQEFKLYILLLKHKQINNLLLQVFVFSTDKNKDGLTSSHCTEVIPKLLKIWHLALVTLSGARICRAATEQQSCTLDPILVCTVSHN